jgi:hypothetical protein
MSKAAAAAAAAAALMYALSRRQDRQKVVYGMTQHH